MVSELIYRLCNTFSGPGDEKNIAEVIKKEMQNCSNEIIIDKNYNVICRTEKTSSKQHILIDAHIDQISMVVTAVDKTGFINISPCGGVDCRVLPGSTVFIYGKKVITGIVCTTPPHLISKGENNFGKTEDLLVDTGYSAEKLYEIVSVGDYVSFSTKPQKLLDSKITAPGLDNRAGVAALIRCAQILKNKNINCEVTFLFSSQEEVRALGAKTAAFLLNPTESISVDVSFAKQPDVVDEKCGKLSHGPMIDIAPVLSRDISNKFINLAKQNNIPYQLEIMNSSTGTTSDVIATTKSGVYSGLLSIPLKYMHTPVEVIDVNDIEATSELLALYILSGGNKNV